MKYVSVHKILLVAIALSLPSMAVYAQTGFINCDGGTCGTANFLQMVAIILEFLIKISVVLAGIVIAWGGFTMATSAGDLGKVKKGRTLMTNAVIGIIITLAAWLLVDTIMGLILKDPNSWKSIINVGQNIPTNNIPPQRSGSVGTSPGRSTESGLSGNKISHESAISELKNAGVEVVSTNGKVYADCTGISGCTSLQGINQATIKDVIDLKNECQCDVTITGGTETTGGHANTATGHTSGSKYDAAKNNKLDHYIKENYVYSGIRSDGAVLYKAPDGVLYADEGNHWDVQVISS